MRSELTFLPTFDPEKQTSHSLRHKDTMHPQLEKIYYTFTPGGGVRVINQMVKLPGKKLTTRMQGMYVPVGTPLKWPLLMLFSAWFPYPIRDKLPAVFTSIYTQPHGTVLSLRRAAALLNRRARVPFTNFCQKPRPPLPFPGPRAKPPSPTPQGSCVFICCRYESLNGSLHV